MPPLPHTVRLALPIVVGGCAVLAVMGRWPTFRFDLFWALAGAPIVEEVIFRRGLQQALQERLGRLGPYRERVVITLTALAFAAVHWIARPGGWSVLTFLPALLIGAVYARTQRLWPCIVLHGAFNGFWQAMPRHWTN